MRWFDTKKFKAIKNNDKEEKTSYPLVPREVWCAVCNAQRTFTKVWRRAVMMRTCPNCGLNFPDPAGLYKRSQPMCSRCREPLEQPNFDYGYCDVCGSKFELVEGGKPGLLPNQQQRQEMDKHGKSWSYL